MNFTEMMSSDLDAGPISDILLPEDIWSKFQLDQELNSAFFSSFDSCWNWMDFGGPPKCLIHHDCMWTGLCSSKEHNMDETKSLVTSPVGNNTPAASTKTPPPQQQQQQSVLKPLIKNVVSPYTILPKMETITPQTPPMSDDEESKKPTTTLQILHDAIYENIIDDDSDLSDYFKEEIDIIQDVLDDDDDLEEEEEEEEENDDSNEQEDEQSRMAQLKAYQFAAESDHSYHKGNFYARTANLGIDTPSDSEEEIDVVSLGEKFNSGALPTNPSSRDRQKLQRTMHSRFPNGIKTILPLRKQHQAAVSPPCPPPVMIKRRASTTPKRSQKQYNKNQKQYKRRPMYGHSSDSEPEPSEKRSLHNNMERQRRIDLRNLFEDLKALVPDVNKKQRAAKVLILRGAAQYCRNLTNTSANLNRQVDDLKKQQSRLLARVSQLRRNLAAHR